MIPNLKVEASALQSVLTVSLIIVLIVSAMMAASVHISRIYQEKKRTEKLQRNARSGMNLLLAGAIDFKDSVIIDLYGNLADSVMLKKSTWGVYDVLQTTAFIMHDSVRIKALCGVALTPEYNYALYLADQHLPLSVSGETAIKGSVFIPEAGIRRSYIEGREFTSKEVVSGKIDFSGTEPPELNSKVVDRLFQGFEIDSIAVSAPLEDLDNGLEHSFESPTIMLFIEDSLDIEGSLKGNIKIHSKSEVRVSADSELENILIYAKSIIVEKGFEGSFQGFASDSIRIQDSVTLNYPSVLGLLPSENGQHEFNPQIVLGQESRVNGLVFSVWPNKEDVSPLIKLDSADVYGQVFSAGMLQLKGKITGTTTTQGFILRTPSTLYENFVLDGVMDRDALSPYYLGSSLLNMDSVRQIMKWL